MPNANTQSNSINEFGFLGQPWLVEERDACGVGYLANPQNVPSREIVSMALNALTCLEHRGGCSADRDSGDGAGVMTAIPWQLFDAWLQEHNPNSYSLESIGVGMVFFSQDPVSQQAARQIVEETIASYDLQLLGWRKVPVRPEVLGVQAKENQPHIEQMFVHSPDKTGDELERHLYLTRRAVG
ncbi:MAG: glutamate synthase subunit alpha, partial [Chroococcales cyanobacterium]